jgi:glycosyltransferase involved in cell wall biosynthesis
MNSNAPGKYEVNTFLRKVVRKVRKMLPKEDIHNKKIVSLKTKNGNNGNILLAYRIEPFLLKGEALDTLLKKHTNYWESLQMANTFLDIGYDVDVISYLNERLIPKKSYQIYINARTNFQKIAERLNSNCIKIVHLETAHWLFNNCEAHKRYLSLQRKRGLTLKTRKIIRENWAIESADCATMLGNNFTKSTYAYANKTIFTLPVPAVQVYPWQEDKDYEACRNRFLWLGSEALVNKGLDLALETFSNMPDFELIVCGPIEKESDFREAFYKELYQTANIKTVGWVDIASRQFSEFAKSCVGLIYPSCSEGQSGAVITCLQAGLIPIVSYESGVDAHDFGLVLNDCTVEEIECNVRSISERPIEELKKMSRSAWEFARENNTKENYAKVFRSTMERIILKEAVLRHGKNTNTMEE